MPTVFPPGSSTESKVETAHAYGRSKSRQTRGGETQPGRHANQQGSEVKSLSELLDRGNLSNLIQRHKQGVRLQQVLDELLGSLNLPGALVTPGRSDPKHNSCEYVLNVQSATEATQLRNQIPQLQMRLRPRLGRSFTGLTLRVRTRPSVARMHRRAAPRLDMPDRIRQRLATTASELANQRLRHSLERLVREN